MQKISRCTYRILAFLLMVIMLFTVTYRKADAATPNSTVSAKATLAYTLKGLKFGRAVQNFYIGSTYIYITQRKDGITYLSRLRMNGNTATFVDYMTLNNFGHGQSLDMYKYNGENWFYIGCKADPSTSYQWSLQVARMKYEAGKTYDYTDMNRLSYMNYATKSSSRLGTTYRVAVGGNSTYTIFRIQTTGGTVTFSIYDTAKLNKLLDGSKSVQMNTSAARACCLYYFTQSGSGIVRPNGSFQGIDMTGLSNIYVSGGAHGDTPQIAKMNRYGTYLKLFKITNVGSLEIEGVQCKNDVIYFCIVPGTTSDLKKNYHKIYAIQESGKAPTLPTPVPTATPTVKPTTAATPTPTVKPTATAAPTTAAGLTLQQVLTGMSAVNTYEKQNGALPAAATFGSSSLNQASYCRLACVALANINAGNTSASIPYVACTEPAGVENTFSGSTISKEAYLDAASRFLTFMNNNSNVPPNYASFPGANNISQYDGELAYDVATLAYVRALDYYNANGSLPATVSTQNTTVAATAAPTTQAPTTATEFTLDQLTEAAASAVNAYTTGSPFFRDGITVNGVKVAQQNYYIMAAQAVQDIYNNNTSATYSNTAYNYNVPNLVANYTITNADGTEATSASKALYMNFAIRQTAYVKGTGAGTVGASAVYPTTDSNANGFAVADYTGQMTYEAGLLMFSRILASYAQNGKLPDSVALQYVPAEGTETTIAPATAAPATQAPATAAPEAVPTAHPALDSIVNGTKFTVAEIAAAAGDILSHYNKYNTLETEYSIPKAVNLSDYVITDDDWAYMAGYALAGLAGTWTASNLSGYTADTNVPYLKATKPAVEAAGTYEATELSLDKTVEIAWKTTNFANNNAGLMPASCSSAFTGYQVSYYSGLIASARALNYYSVNGSLPATVEFSSMSYTTADTDTNEAETPIVSEEPLPTEAVETDEPIPTEDPSETEMPMTTEEPEATEDPDATPEPENGEYSRAAVLYAGYSISKSITNNPGVLPNYANINGAQVKMPELLNVFARLIVDTNNGLSAAVPMNGILECETVYEQLTAGSLTKEQYAALAEEVLVYGAENGVAPGCLECGLGTVSFNTLISIFANVISELKTTGELPTSVSVEAWGSPLPIPPEEHALELPRENVFYAASVVCSALENYNKFPNYATIDGETVYMPELIGVLAQLILDENDGLVIPVSRNDATYAEKSYEQITGSSLTKEQYVAAAQAVVDYIAGAGTPVAPGFVETEAGTLSYETLLATFAKICVELKNTEVLPESAEVSAWTASSLPTPPDATETPEYQYLNFVGILKGARRVVNAIESASTVPNYVTLDTNTRIYPGTMLRIFAATVSNINRGKAIDVPLDEIATPSNIANETLTNGTFTKAEYTKIANRIANVVYANGAVPTYITTGIGTMNYYNMIYMFANILEYYLTYGFLPEQVNVQAWGTYEF